MQNISLLSVGIAVVCMVILAFTILLKNRRSITNKIFFIFSLITAIWSILNYLSFQFNSPFLILWILRFVMFLGVWHAFSIFTLFYVFPKEEIKFSKLYKFILIPVVIIVSLLTLTPLVFIEIAEMLSTGGAAKIINGPAISLFGLSVIYLILSGFWLLVKKMLKATGIEKKQFIFIFSGAIIFFFLLLIYNFILPAFFDNPHLIPLSAIFVFPFIGFTAYAIIKHGLFNVKIIATESLIFIIWIFLLIDTLSGENWQERSLRGIIFILTIIFGIFLIKSVIKEVQQREEMEKLSEELKAVNEKMIEMDKMKAGMYSFVSHQIKAPMGIIKGFAQLLSQNSYGELPQKAKETVDVIKKTTDRLIKLVEDFLDLRRIDEGKMDYKFEEINIINLVKEVVGELEFLARQKHLELTFSSETDEIKIKIDEQRMHQAIQNLIENAIKYTEKGFVKVECRTSNVNGKEFYLVSVSDSGMGIAGKDLTTVFNQFDRAQAARTIKGTGLGLYIAKEIVKAHNGEIWAESEGEGKGSRFYVKLTRNN